MSKTHSSNKSEFSNSRIFRTQTASKVLLWSSTLCRKGLVRQLNAFILRLWKVSCQAQTRSSKEATSLIQVIVGTNKFPFSAVFSISNNPLSWWHLCLYALSKDYQVILFAWGSSWSINPNHLGLLDAETDLIIYTRFTTQLETRPFCWKRSRFLDRTVCPVYRKEEDQVIADGFVPAWSNL